VVDVLAGLVEWGGEVGGMGGCVPCFEHF
jgi:hypothetical protein